MYGTGETVNASADTIDYGNNASGNVVGNNDALYLASADIARVYGTGETVNGSADTIYYGNNASGNVVGNNDVLNLGSGDTAGLFGTGETVNGSGYAINCASNASANVAGGNDTVNMASGDYLGLLGGAGYIVTASGDAIGTQGSTSLNLSGGSDTVSLGGSNDYLGLLGGTGYGVTASGDTIGTLAGTGFNLTGSNDTASLGGSADYLGLITGDRGEMVNGSGDQITTLNGVTGVTGGSGDRLSAGVGCNFNLNGNGDIASVGRNSYVGVVAGTNELIGASGVTIVLLPGVSVTVIGSNDRIEGNYDTVSISGNDDYTIGSHDGVYASGTKDFTDGYSDTFSGSDYSYDPGSGYSYGYGGYGNYGFVRGTVGHVSSGIDVVAQYDQSQGFTLAADTAAAALAAATQSADGQLATSAATLPSNPASGIWAGRTITWSFAAGASSGPTPFSGAIAIQFQPIVQQAVQAWAAALGACGISVQMVSTSAGADFSIGWGDFDTTASNVAGYTDVHRAGTLLMQGGTVRLKDPNQTPLVTGTDGQPVYAGMDATLYQIALHEVGHALGLRDVSDPNSVMYYSLGASNRTLDATDIAAIRGAYLAPSVTPTAANIAQLSQVMAAYAGHAHV